ncbi:HET-domain-containing protein [Decorospora gaudefroyi]|uniref:HET-domain-containing protein n=1 Tax=Decorospora gaudefroyi TaxID=184978 RepID=A0A6A5KQA1_9PLEO|nr:HET-domain-containing protein [Decorospora gaudefroyi]
MTHKQSPEGRYIALSYRWGDSQHLLLKSSNLAQLSQRQPISTLPRTFQDTVQVAKVLDFDYIWIDALCIMQDSLQDWRQESMQMKDIYANAYCTVAASWAPNPDGGLFKLRNVEDVRCGSFKADILDGSSINIRLLERGGFHNEIFRAPLHGRAWILQERILSPQVLFFTEQQVMWESENDVRCEAFEDDLPSHYVDESIWLRTFLQRSKFDSDDEHYDLLVEYWAQCVDVYSLCHLTVPADKLIAIDGIVQKLKKVHKVEYVAGIWWHRICKSLLWSGNGLLQRPDEYRAPSFSWASLDGAVRMYHEYYVRRWQARFPFETINIKTEKFNTSLLCAKIVEAYKDICVLELRGHAPVWDPEQHDSLQVFASDTLKVEIMFDVESDEREVDLAEKPIWFLLLQTTMNHRQGILVQELDGDAQATEATMKEKERCDKGKVYARRVGFFSTRGAWAVEAHDVFGIPASDDPTDGIHTMSRGQKIFRLV